MLGIWGKEDVEFDCPLCGELIWGKDSTFVRIEKHFLIMKEIIGNVNVVIMKE